MEDILRPLKLDRETRELLDRTRAENAGPGVLFGVEQGLAEQALRRVTDPFLEDAGLKECRKGIAGDVTHVFCSLSVGAGRRLAWSVLSHRQVVAEKGKEVKEKKGGQGTEESRGRGVQWSSEDERDKEKGTGR